MTIDGNAVVQAVSIAALIGVGKTLWSANTAFTRLTARFEAHEESDKAFHAEVKTDIRELRDGR